MTSKIFDIRTVSTWSFNNLNRDFELEKKMLSSFVFHSIEKIRENNSILDTVRHSKNLAVYTICIIPLYIPVLKTITYLAYLVIFPYDLEKSYKSRLEEGNLAGAFTLIERGSIGKVKDQNGKTLLDLYLKKFNENKGTEEDLDITIKLWNQGIPFDETEKGALPFLKKAITKKGVEYCVTLDNERKRVHKELMDQIPSQLLFKVEQQEFQKLLARSPTLLHQYQKELTPSLKGVIDSMQREEELLKRSMDTYTTGTIVGKVASGEMWGPLETLNQGTKDPLTTLESEMNEEIIGQEAAIKAVCNRIRLDSIGMKERNRPVGVFMCVGPTGVGKTSLAKVLAKKIMGSEDQLIRLDMQTYTNEHSIENLLGAPVGYKDHEKSAAWIKALKKNPKSVILLDEIEKSHAKVRQIFLGAFDEGHFVDNEGKKVDCSQAIFVLTSNSGSREILFHGIEKKTTGKSTFWFGKEEPPEPLESLKTVVHRAIAEEFQPEFINRMDNILVFNKLDNPNLSKKIILRELDFFKSRAKKSHQVTVNWTSRLVDYLAIKGFSSTMGARPLKRIVDSKIGTFYTDAILRKEIKRKDEIVIDINENGMIQFSKVQKTP